MTNISLDSIEDIKKIDTEDFLSVLDKFPQQCKEAWEIGRSLRIPVEQYVKRIVVTALGGSAIGGDFLRVFVSKFGTVPVVVNRDYTLPGFVDKNTLVFAVSYSGNTEETLAAYEDAKAKGAQIIVLTSGGELAKRAQEDDYPLITIPSGFQPRAATGYLFLPLLAAVERLELLNEKVEMEPLIADMENLRKRVAVESPEAQNPAKTLAKQLYKRIPVIYGTSGFSEAVAMRFKGQINENSKALAYFNVFPELNHNEVVGTEYPIDLLKSVTLVYLRSKDDHPRVSKRFDITKEMLKDRITNIIEVNTEGANFLSRMFYLTYIGDVMSVYLAILYGANPTPVEIITTLKNKLKES